MARIRNLSLIVLILTSLSACASPKWDPIYIYAPGDSSPMKLDD